MIRTFCRGAIHFLLFARIVVFSFSDYVLRIACRGKSGDVRARAEWLRRWSIRTLKDLRVTVTRRGTPPSAGLLTSNHLSYLDILVLSSTHPMVFVAKSEVRGWPVMGRLARCAGTLFIRRDRKADVARVNAAFDDVIRDGVVVAVFPEGTSWNGEVILPFHSSMFQPVVDSGWKVTPASVGYTMTEGSVSERVCYWGDMTFLPHFLRLLAQRGIHATVTFGPPLPSGLDRKQLAQEARRWTCELGGVPPAEGGGRLTAPRAVSTAR
ncbi:MAG: lysophospholipid acyltransferase family protein [Verrucomicrobiota bacterium]